MHSFIGFRKSTPPQHRQLNILVGNSRQYVDDFMGVLTFENHLINALCEIRMCRLPDRHLHPPELNLIQEEVVTP